MFYLAFGALAFLKQLALPADAADDYGYAATGSDFFFQLMFCAATASIVSGALAERIKLWPFLVFTIILTSIIYPLQASWKWGGGFLDAMGFLDFAGSTVVHSVGGWAALVGALDPWTTYRQIQRRQNNPNARFKPDTCNTGYIHPVDGLVRI